METRKIPNVLTIAGVDPSGGAGVLADVKVISAVGCFATSVIAALTAQNTRAVTGIYPVSADFVHQQLKTLFDDVQIDAIKIGMLGDKEVMKTVAEFLQLQKAQRIVLDTVMVAKSGDRLMPDDAVEVFCQTLLPLAHVITPNIPEAEVLLGRKIETEDDLSVAARDLSAMTQGRAAVYMKGGHLDGSTCRDFFFDGQTMQVLESSRTYTKNTHGTGCSLSSAIAAYWAKLGDLNKAVFASKRYITQAIAQADMLNVGTGHGPIHHFGEVWAYGLT